MKKQFLLIACTLIFSVSAFCQSLTINSEKAIVDFNFVSEKTVGTVKGINATINFDTSDLSVSSIEGSADITTLSTENKMRDRHLQEEDMFNAAKFPTMVFRSSSIEKTEKGYAMTGHFYIKAIRIVVVINFTYNDNTFIGKTIVYSNDFDVLSKKKREDSKVLIKITIPVL